MDYSKSSEPATKQPPPIPQEATLKKASLPSPPPEPSASNPRSTNEALLNSRRLSGVKQSSFSWNERWQKLCDAVTTDSSMDSGSLLELTSDYCSNMMKEVDEMRDKIFQRFLCPENLRSTLQDGFYDKDSCFYSDNGSLFIIPMHVSPPCRVENRRSAR